MKNFIEFLAEKDPALLQEYIYLASLSENSWHKYLLPLMLGAQATAQAGTPTELKQRQDYNQSLKDPRNSRNEKELHSRMFTQGITVDDLVGRKFSWSKTDRNKDTMTKLDRLDLPDAMRKGIPSEHEEEYKQEDILFKKVINPYDYIRSTQHDKEKFDRDYQKLNTDNPNDKGFSTFKHKFNNQVLMYVVKANALSRVEPGASGYHTVTINPDTGKKIEMIVLPDTAFKTLPSGNSLGELTDDGTALLAHELRHGTQRSENVPVGKYQTDNSNYHHYMHDPMEIGVRLAATKNLMSPDTILRLTKNYPKHQEIAKNILQKASESEKELMKMIMNPEGENANTLHFIRDRLKVINKDVDSLFQFYDTLKGAEKANFMKQLIDNYDNVVKNNTKTSTT
jgi:hypothetical protein